MPSVRGMRREFGSNKPKIFQFCSCGCKFALPGPKFALPGPVTLWTTQKYWILWIFYFFIQRTSQGTLDIPVFKLSQCVDPKIQFAANLSEFAFVRSVTKWWTGPANWFPKRLRSPKKRKVPKIPKLKRKKILTIFWRKDWKRRTDFWAKFVCQILRFVAIRMPNVPTDVANASKDFGLSLDFAWKKRIHSISEFFGNVGVTFCQEICDFSIIFLLINLFFA